MHTTRNTFKRENFIMENKNTEIAFYSCKQYLSIAAHRRKLRFN